MLSDEAGNAFRFVDSVDGPPRYSILNYQRTANGTYHWTVVGNYTRKLNFSRVLLGDNGGRVASRERARSADPQAGSGEAEISWETGRRVPHLLLLAALRLESDHGKEQGGSVLLEMSELRPLPVQGGRAEVRGVRAGHRADRERDELRADCRAVRGPLGSLGDRRDGDSRAR